MESLGPSLPLGKRRQPFWEGALLVQNQEGFLWVEGKSLETQSTSVRWPQTKYQLTN